MTSNNNGVDGENLGVLSNHRLIDIDVAKGLAIILVVLGHIVARQPPADNHWFLYIKEAIYSFHMAFFMFLSGVVFFLKIKVVSSFGDYGHQVWKRFLRLMPAYFLFALAVFLAKLLAQHFMYVDNPVNGLADMVGILLYPMESISAFLWYIYVLFQFCVVGLALMTLSGGSIVPLVGLGVGLLFVQASSFLGMDQFCKFFLFFSLGGLAIRYWSTYTILVDRIWKPTMVVFILTLIFSGYYGLSWIPSAVLSLVALHGLCRQQLPFVNILSFLGLMSFPVYLMNTLCIGFVKAIMLKFISWDGVNFIFFAVVLFFAGLIIPIVLKIYLIRRVSWLDQITS